MKNSGCSRCPKDIRKPPAGRHRERRLVDDEETRLLAACRKSRNPGLETAVILAIETGMRLGEIGGLTWDRVDLAAGVVRLDLTKNGERRTVPLSDKAVSALRSVPRNLNGNIFTIKIHNMGQFVVAR